MRLLANASYRLMTQRRGQWLLALIGMASGIAVMSGVWLMQTALLGSLDRATQTLIGQTIVSVQPDRGRLSEDIYRDLVLRPQAPELYPIIEANVRHQDQSMRLLGVDPLSGLGPTGGLSQSPVVGQLIGTKQALVSANTAEHHRLTVGDSIVVEYQQTKHALQVAAILETGPALDDHLIVDISSAQEMLGWLGELSRIDAPASQLSWLQQNKLTGTSIQTTATARDSAAQLSRGMRTNLTAMSLLALAVGLLVVYSVISFLLVQRKKMVALLRAIGVPRSQIVLQLLGEVGLLAVFGGGLGLILGTELANGLLALLKTPFASIYQSTPDDYIRASWPMYATIWSLGLLMAWGSVLGVLNEAFHIPPGQLARTPLNAHRPAKPWSLWALIGAGLGAALIASQQHLIVVLAGLFLVLASVSVWIPKLGFGLLAWQKNRLGQGLIRRAWVMLLSARTRLGPALSALSLALALSAGVGMMVLGFRQAVDDWVGRLLQADVYFTMPSTPIPATLATTLEALWEIDSISTTRGVDGPGPHQVIAYDLPPKAWAGFDWIDAPTKDARMAMREAFEQGQGVLITQPLATKQGIARGQTIALDSPAGTQSFEVLGIYRDYASEQGSIAITGTLYQRLWNDTQKDTLGLYLNSNVTLAELEMALADALDPAIQYQLTTPAEIREQTMAVFDQTFRISWALAWLVGMIASIALISALLAMGIERGREYATLRALGLTPRQLGALVIHQTLGIAVLAALLALPVSVLIHSVLSAVIQPMAFGWHIPWSLPLMPWLMTALMALAIGIVAGLYPARLISNTPPARLLRQLS